MSDRRTEEHERRSERSHATTTVDHGSAIGDGSGPPPPVLLALAGPASGAQYLLEEPIVRMGRSPRCGIVVGDEGLSRTHCEIVLRGEAVQIIDLGSKNGTWVDQERVEPRRPSPLYDGSLVRVGQSVFKFVREPSAAEVAYHHRMYRRAHQDPVTDAHTPSHLIEWLEREAATASRRDGNLALIFAGIDHFERVNDELGMDIGDSVLRSVAQTLQSQVRSGDCVCRWGGDEFAVGVVGSRLETAVDRAERLREALGEISIPGAGGGILQVSASFGVAHLGGEREGDESVRGLVSRARRCLQLAKQTGRNRIVSDGSLGELSIQTLEIQSLGPLLRLRSGRTTQTVTGQQGAFLPASSVRGAL